MNRLRRLDAIRALVEANGGELRFPGHLLRPELQKIEYRLSRAIDTKWEVLSEKQSVLDFEKNVVVKIHDTPIGIDKLGVLSAIKDQRKMIELINEAHAISAFTHQQKVDYICDSDESFYSPMFDFKSELESVLRNGSPGYQAVNQLSMRGQKFIFKSHHPETEHPGFGEREEEVNGEVHLNGFEKEIVNSLVISASKKASYPDAFVIEFHGELIRQNLSISIPNEPSDVLTLTPSTEKRLRKALEEYRKIGELAFSKFASDVICTVERPDRPMRTQSRMQGIGMLKERIGQPKTPREDLRNVATEKVDAIHRKMNLIKIIDIKSEIMEWKKAIDVVVSQNPGLPEKQIYETWNKILTSLSDDMAAGEPKVYEIALGRINKLYGRMLNRHSMAKIEAVYDWVGSQALKHGRNSVLDSIMQMLKKEIADIEHKSPLMSFKVAEDVLSRESVEGVVLSAVDMNLGPFSLPRQAVAENAHPETGTALKTRRAV